MQIVIDIPEGTFAKIKRQAYVHTFDADKIGKAIKTAQCFLKNMID